MVKHFYGFVGLPGNWVDDNDRSYPEKFFEGKEYEDRIFDNFFEMDKEFGHKNSLFGTRGLEPGDPNRTSKSFNHYNEKFGPMIVRVLKNNGLKESIKKILREDVSLNNKIRKQIDKLGLYEFMRLSGWSWSKIVSIIGVDFLTYKMMSEFIPAALNEIGAFGLGEINEDTILYNSNQDEVREINYLGINRAIVDVWGGIDFQEHKGEFGVHYYNLPDNILEEVFDVVIRVYEENSDI